MDSELAGCVGSGGNDATLVALSADDQSFTRRYQFRGTRDWIKLITSQVALDWLRRYALGLPIADSTLFRR